MLSLNDYIFVNKFLNMILNNDKLIHHKSCFYKTKLNLNHTIALDLQENQSIYETKAEAVAESLFIILLVII